MKPNRRPLPIPQFEFRFVPDTFALIREYGLDGDRLARECSVAEEARKLAESAQFKLFARRSRKRNSRRLK
jgi:hypothetical protein